MHVDHASAVKKKRDHQMFVGGFALSGLLDSVVQSGRKRQYETDSRINSTETTIVGFRAY